MRNRTTRIAAALATAFLGLLSLRAVAPPPERVPAPEIPSGGSAPVRRGGPLEPAATHVVIVVIDGCRPDYLQRVDTPNLGRLMAEGVTYDRAFTGHLRNDTPPGHATLATGTFPRRHGIIGFAWKDPVTGSPVRPASWNEVTSGTLNRLVRESGVLGLGSLYRRAHPGAKVVALSSDKYYAAAAFGAESAGVVAFCEYSPAQKYGTKVGETLAPSGVAGLLPPADVLASPALRRKVVNPWDGDTWTVDLAIALLERERPEVLLVNLSLTDNAGHLSGVDSDDVAAVVANADAQIGRLVDAYRSAGLYERTLFVVTSDHGMSRHRRTIDDTGLSTILTQCGMTRAASRLEYDLRDPARSRQAAEAIGALSRPGIHAVYYKTRDEDGSFRYLPATAGSGALDASLDATYRLLTDSYASGRSADVVVFPAEGWNTKEAAEYFVADHGTATWDNQRVPLVLTGPRLRKGITSSAPARLVDVAPTLLQAMGIEPEGMDGTVLADALTAPSSELVRTQSELNRQLEPLLRTLELRHTGDLRRDQVTDFVFTRDYTPGTRDENGRDLSGNELMRLTAYKGELFASTSTFTEPRLYTNAPGYTGAQVLRKASSSSGWVADVSFGRRYLRTDALEAVRFTRDAGGAPLPEPVEMLVAGIWDLGELGAGAASGRGRFITVAVRDDARMTWTLSRVASVPDAEKGFASVRAMKVHTDRVTGLESLFVGAACGGVYKGVYDPGVPGRIRWTGGDEVDVSFGRLHSMCRANGDLYGSFDYGGLTVQNQTGGIFRRVDGDEPRWERVYRNYDPRYPTWNQTGRGITAVPAADGSGREVILAGIEWPPDPVIVRIEPHDGHRAVTELDYNQYFTEVFGRSPQILGGSKENPHAGVQAAALNMFEPFADPRGGGDQRFVTLFLVHPDDPAEGHNGAYFLIRRAPGVYDWGEIPSGLPSGQNLRGTRTVEKSPFPDEPNVWYFGGGFAGPDVQPPRPNTAWIYKGTLVPTR